MAILYMLHVESFYEDKLPKMSDGNDGREVGITSDQRELCKSFGFWAECQCQNACGRKWNFANKVGISRGGTPEHFCAVAMSISEGQGNQPWWETRVKWERQEE